MAATKPRQGSLPGTNIPELEKVAESYYTAVEERIAAGEVEKEAKAALTSTIDALQKSKKIPTPKADGKKVAVYRYTGDKEDGSVTPRIVYDATKQTRTINVRNEKDDDGEEEEVEE